MNPSEYTLISGAAAGTESTFGEQAEKWGVNEVNITFEGHRDARTRGLKILSQSELRHGDVSLAYVGRLMHREYKDSPLFRKVLQSIWHQVDAGEQVFVVGWIREDGTVKGGTGWGAEVAKLFNKDLYAYDQGKTGWFHWNDLEWRRCETPPMIEATSFTGTGTRLLEDNGRAAIVALFTRSFGG